EEKADLWPKVTGKYKGYAGYQTKTSREIPLVILEPA
ncbi:MAG: nitroreductase/quinone reductase family protein, partial [Actinomycetota bacterium]